MNNDATSGDASLRACVDLIAHRRVVVLSGAGMSTESGIPDYRGPQTHRMSRNPVQYRAFIHQPEARRRYWARSMIGWPRLAAATPNPGHRALAELERRKTVVGVITQNVDRLHHAAGSRRVIELHGALAEVICLRCGAVESRAAVQERLRDKNPAHETRHVELAPDGDAELSDASIEGFREVECVICGGVLKPHVVFFGENVPKPIVQSAFDLLDSAEVLLVIGTSLTVFSGFRFVRRAAERGLPIGIVNLGATRGDPYADIRIEARSGELLPALLETLPVRAPVT